MRFVIMDVPLADYRLPQSAKFCHEHTKEGRYQKNTMNQNIIREIDKEQIKETIPQFNVGDRVRVHNRIVEGARQRVQIFEGDVTKRQNGGIRETFTVRRVTSGIGVEKTWPLHSPLVINVEVVRRGVVRRAKLFYLRDRVGKKAKIKEAIVAKKKK